MRNTKGRKGGNISIIFQKNQSCGTECRRTPVQGLICGLSRFIGSRGAATRFGRVFCLGASDGYRAAAGVSRQRNFKFAMRRTAITARLSLLSDFTAVLAAKHGALRPGRAHHPRKYEVKEGHRGGRSCAGSPSRELTFASRRRNGRQIRRVSEWRGGKEKGSNKHDGHLEQESRLTRAEYFYSLQSVTQRAALHRSG